MSSGKGEREVRQSPNLITREAGENARKYKDVENISRPISIGKKKKLPEVF